MLRARSLSPLLLLVSAGCAADPRPPSVADNMADGIGGPGAGSEPGGSVDAPECADSASCADGGADAGQQVPDEHSLYLPGTRGFVQLAFGREAWGAYQAAPLFYVEAQFVESEGQAGEAGQILDPLEGVDDCGVFASSGTGNGGARDFFAVESAALESEAGRFPLALSSASHDGFWSYAAALDRTQPSYGETYRFVAQGGGLNTPIDVPVRLPQELSIGSLAGVTSVPADELALQWSGSGDAPLRLQLWVDARLNDISNAYRIECQMADDGEFVIPAEVLRAAPAGIVTATFSRSARSVEESGGQRLLTIGKLSVTHRFALAPVAANSAVRDACLTHQAYLVGAYSACAVLNVPNQAVTCPDYLAEASGSCASYFSCRSEHLRCTPAGLLSDAACSCP